MQESSKIESLEYDKRQYLIMLEKITFWQKAKFPLGELVTDLEALTNLLKLADEGWKQDFMKKVWVLDTVYAVALDEGRDFYTFDDEKLINETISFLKDQSEQAIQGIQDTLG